MHNTAALARRLQALAQAVRDEELEAYLDFDLFNSSITTMEEDVEAAGQAVEDTNAEDEDEEDDSDSE